MARGRSRKRQRPNSTKEAGWQKIPNDIVIDIMTRLPGKQLGRCKCVCKSWLAMIESETFSDNYKKERRCMMLYWAERIAPPSDLGSTRLRFYYSPLSRRHPEEFQPVLDLAIKSNDHVTQLVNCVICVMNRERGYRVSTAVVDMKAYNVCTGQTMAIPKPKPFANTVSTYHLGYSPATGTYKLLRMIFHLGSQGAFHGPPRAKIITLGPDAVWRSLKYDQAGIRNLSAMRTSFVYYAVKFNEARTFAGDGALCWFFLQGEGLISFNVNEERFRVVKLPPEVKNDKGQIVPRTAFNGMSMWIVPGEEWYVLEDQAGEEWSKHHVKLPEDVRGCMAMGGLGVANGSHTSLAPVQGEPGEVMLMNRHNAESMAVYTYGRSRKVEKFYVGKLPEKKPLDPRCRCNVNNRDSLVGFDARLSCLLDSNHLYMPLTDVLSGFPN